jgi:hypothetical protein
VAAREPLLDPLLTRKQPVQRAVELILVGASDSQLVAERRLRQRADGRKLRARRERLLTDHRQTQIALAARRAVKQPSQLQPARHRQHRPHVAGRQRALDRKRRLAVDIAATGKRAADQLDHLIGQVREVRQRLVLDLGALTVGAAQQMRHVLPMRPLPTVGDDMHRARRTTTTAHAATLPPPSDDN